MNGIQVTTEGLVESAASVLAEADALLIAAGAGMGVDSGLPDYRSEGGFYNAYPLYKKLGITYETATRPKGFRTDAAFAWGFWGHLLSMYRNTVPHKGFKILLDIGQKKSLGCFVVTTNIDGQFQKAGFPEEKIHEGHGSVHRLQCQEPCVKKTWSSAAVNITVDLETMRAVSELPKCPFCKQVARPHVFMFGDSQYIWEECDESAERFRSWEAQIKRKRKKLVIVECGAGTVAPGLRKMCEELTLRIPHSTLVRINPREADSNIRESGKVISLPLPALDALKKISELSL